VSEWIENNDVTQSESGSIDRRSYCDEFKNDRNDITVISMLFCISLPNYIEIGPSAAEE